MQLNNQRSACRLALHNEIKLNNKINVKNKPAHNRTKHDATARHDDDDTCIDDIVIMLQFNLIKDDDIANIYNYII